MNRTSISSLNGRSKWIWCQKICPRKFSPVNFYINMTFSRLCSNTFGTRIANISADDDDRFSVFINLIAADVRSKAWNLFTNEWFIKTAAIRGNTNNSNQHVSSTVNETKELGHCSKPIHRLWKRKCYGMFIMKFCGWNQDLNSFVVLPFNWTEIGNRNSIGARWMTLFGSISILIRSLFLVSVFVSSWFSVRLFHRSEFNWNHYFRWNQKSRKVFIRNLILLFEHFKQWTWVNGTVNIACFIKKLLKIMRKNYEKLWKLC